MRRSRASRKPSSRRAPGGFSARRTTLVAASILASLASASAAHAGAQRSFDYIHAEADSGSSSGGHAAIRFGDEVFHFQHAEPGIVRAVSEPFEYFDYVYRAVGNRGLHVSRVRVSETTYHGLRDAFARRHLTQEAHLEALASARRDRVLLEYLEDARRGGGPRRSVRLPDLQLRGAGYFFAGQDAATVTRHPAAEHDDAELHDALTSGGASAFALLRREVERRHGAGYLVSRAAAVDREISGLRFACAAPPDFVAGKVPVTPERFAEQYARLLLARLAIEVLATEREPVTQAFRVVRGDGAKLDDASVEALRVHAKAMARDVVRLLGSRRRDWGFPALVKLARMMAMSASVRLERLVVPDVYSIMARRVEVASLAARSPLAQAALDERRAGFEEAKAASLRLDSDDEASWSRMELAANLMIELEDGLRTGAPVRLHEQAPVPSRDAAFDDRWPLPAVDGASASAALACAERREAEIEARLRALYGYNVVTRNCVTEIFAIIDAALSAEPARLSAADLGGRVDGGRALNFVPFVSAAAVNRSYQVVAREHLPSYRTYWLGRCRSRGCGVGTRLRETNTLTSTLYQPGPRTEAFLFFTDTAPPLRPIAGAVNLAIGAGTAVGGLLALPFDRGVLFEAGVRGMTFSLPELAFLNIRKGSNLIVPRDWTRTSPFDDPHALEPIP